MRVCRNCSENRKVLARFHGTRHVTAVKKVTLAQTSRSDPTCIEGAPSHEDLSSHSAGVSDPLHVRFTPAGLSDFEKKFFRISAKFKLQTAD